jgi:hypothetical protein
MGDQPCVQTSAIIHRRIPRPDSEALVLRCDDAHEIQRCEFVRKSAQRIYTGMQLLRNSPENFSAVRSWARHDFCVDRLQRVDTGRRRLCGRSYRTDSQQGKQ